MGIGVLAHFSGKGHCILTQAKLLVSNNYSGVVWDRSAFHGSTDPGFDAFGSI